MKYFIDECDEVSHEECVRLIDPLKLNLKSLIFVLSPLSSMRAPAVMVFVY